MENRQIIPSAILFMILGSVIMAYVDSRIIPEYKEARNTLELILKNANCPTGGSVILYAGKAVATCSGPWQPIRIMSNSLSTKYDYENRNYDEVVVRGRNLTLRWIGNAVLIEEEK